LGLHQNDPAAFQGYTLLSPMNSTKTYLIDMQGRVVKEWKSDYSPAMCAVLLENGNLLRPATAGRGQGFGAIPGAGGRIQEFTWEGELVWDFKFAHDKHLPHHDTCRLPNGNIIMVATDKKTGKEAIAAGRRPELVGDSFLPDCLLEIKPTGKTTGEIVWKWHLWDHLVQDYDKSKPNYGNVAEHPELVNINYGEDVLAPITASKDGNEKLKSIGYVGSARRGRNNPDWTHCNSVAYNPELDQIVLSIHNFSEVWIIDHSTTTAEAAGHQGGRSGRGGDLLYRWGNPRAYGAGTKADQRLFAQHSAHWIPKGLPGEGHLMVFNNGGGRPDGTYSSVDEIALPVDAQGRYERKEKTRFGPEKALWSYAAPKKSEFFSMLISGAQRLPNGNTLVCSGVNGTLFEVTSDNETVWKYVNPAKGGFGPGPGRKGPGGGRPTGFGGPPQPGQLLPSFVQDFLNFTDEQRKGLEGLQKDVDGKLAALLTDEQKEQLKDARGGLGGLPQPGQIMTPFQQTRLKLTDEQKKQMESLQKDADDRLAKLLNEDQQKQFKETRENFARGPGGFGGGPGAGKGPGGAGAPKGPGGFAGFGPPGGASLFRVYRYAANYPGLAGKELAAGKTIEEIEREEEAKAKASKSKEAKRKADEKDR
jgi:hypothetical protein